MMDTRELFDHALQRMKLGQQPASDPPSEGRRAKDIIDTLNRLSVFVIDARLLIKEAFEHQNQLNALPADQLENIAVDMIIASMQIGAIVRPRNEFCAAIEKAFEISQPVPQ